MVEIKSTTSVKDYHRDDIAIRAFVTRAAGVPLESIALAHIDGEWLYPGGDNYQGLLIENDLTEEAFERSGEARGWIGEAHSSGGSSVSPRQATTVGSAVSRRLCA